MIMVRMAGCVGRPAGISTSSHQGKIEHRAQRQGAACNWQTTDHQAAANVKDGLLGRRRDNKSESQSCGEVAMTVGFAVVLGDGLRAVCSDPVRTICVCGARHVGLLPIALAWIWLMQVRR